MAKDTNRRINANLESPKFRKLLEESKRMVKQGKKGDQVDAAYHILEYMNLEKDENNPDLFDHIPDRQLAEILGIGKGTVYNARKRLKQERFEREKVVEKVDTSKVKVIGRGDQSVYLYYFPAHKLNFIYYIKYVDDSHETPIYKCNIGKTKDIVPERVAAQIGQQLPEKPKIALIIKTDDCDSLETEIHDELKRREKWCDPKHDDVVGEEWFLTNPAEVEGIVKSIHRTENSNE